jgi:hypothetical protein
MNGEIEGSEQGRDHGRGSRLAASGVANRRWWTRRNVLGVVNWEWALILFAAGASGIVATMATSLMGVR